MIKGWQLRKSNMIESEGMVRSFACNLCDNIELVVLTVER